MRARNAARAVVREMGGTLSEVFSTSRGTRDAALRRWVCWYAFAKGSTGRRNWSAVGRAFGRDRTTVAHGIHRLEAMMGRDIALHTKVVNIVNSLVGREPD